MAAPRPKRSPTFVNSMLSAPIPGQALTHAPKSMPWEHPPQFVQLDDAMHFLMNQILETHYLKQLLQLMNAGVSIEAMTRTIIFTGFAKGKWTPTLGMLLYKPLMLTLITIAHKAGFPDVPVAHPSILDKYNMNKFKKHMALFPSSNEPAPTPDETVTEQPEEMMPQASGGGFISRNF
jgi:hypothetical protein